MGMQQETVGGGAATGLGNDWASWLRNGLNSGTFGGGNAMQGTFGANPFGSTTGISGVLNDILAGGAGKIGGNLADIISKQGERDVLGLRARFGAGGGTAFGTPGAYAESMLRSQTGANMTNAIGNLQLSALGPIMQMMQGTAQLGIPQAQTIMQPSGWMQGLSMLGPLAQGVGTLMGAKNNKPSGSASTGSSNGGFDMSQLMQMLPFIMSMM